MKNFIFNGTMFWDQNKEGGAYYSGPAEIYSLDHWRYSGNWASGAGQYNVIQTADAPPGFIFSLGCTVTTSQASIISTDQGHIEYPMEAHINAPFAFGTANAKTVTLSFWVKASTVGDYSISFSEGTTNNRCYVTTYTVNIANTWEYKTITIPGDTGGSWPTSEMTFGLKIIWSLGWGSAFQTTSTEDWSQSGKFEKAGTNHFISQPAGSILRITGVQLEIGSTATEYEYITEDEELKQLQRYYYKTFPKGTAVGYAQGFNGNLMYVSMNDGANGNGFMLKYPVKMLCAPNITLYNPSAANGVWRNLGRSVDSSSPLVFCSTEDGCYVYNNQIAADSKNQLMGIHLVANARLGGS